MLNIKIFDLHVHLRDEPKYHIQILAESRYDSAVAMANIQEPLDTLDKIKSYKKKCIGNRVKIFQTSAITRGLKGSKLVDIRKIKPHVVGFSDDGKCLTNLNLLKQIFNEDVLVLAHLEPEVEYLDKYIDVLKKTGRGRLHCQHITKKASLKIIRKAKKEGLCVTAETCPHYLYLNNEIDDLRVNPPLGDEKDRLALLEGLADGTIDAIASDYAPLPRKTGLAGARTFLPLCLGLVNLGVLSDSQLVDKIYHNPKNIIQGHM